MHGEQNGAIDQEAPLGRSDIASVSLLAETGAGVLECRVNGKHGDHSPHLHHRHTLSDTRQHPGLWSLARVPTLSQCGR